MSDARIFVEHIFKSLCEGNNEYYDNMLLHTVVRWFSQRTILIRFHKLYNTILIHIKEHDTIIYIYSKLIYIYIYIYI